MAQWIILAANKLREEKTRHITQGTKKLEWHTMENLTELKLPQLTRSITN
jgi:hypothetical protein